MSEGERWEILESAAARVEFAACRATPGPWWKPSRLDRTVIMAPVPEDEPEKAMSQEAIVVVAVAQHVAATGRLLRNRSNRDMAYMAMVNPEVGKGIAEMLRTVASEMREERGKSAGKKEPESWGACLRLAHRILRTGDKRRPGE